MEMLGSPPLLIGKYVGEKQTLANFVQYVSPTNTTIAQNAEQDPELPMLLLSDTTLASLLFFDGGAVNDAFKALYTYSLDYDPDAWRMVFRQFASVNETLRTFGQGLFSLYGEGRIPSKEDAQAFASSTADAARTLLALHAPVSTPKCATASPPQNESFRPESLN